MRFPREYWMIYSGQAFWPCLIWLLPHLPSPVSTVDRDTHKKTEKRDNLLTEEGNGRGQIKGQRESLVVYKSFNTLWRFPLHWLNAKFNFQPFNEPRPSELSKLDIPYFSTNFEYFAKLEFLSLLTTKVYFIKKTYLVYLVLVYLSTLFLLFFFLFWNEGQCWEIGVDIWSGLRESYDFFQEKNT